MFIPIEPLTTIVIQSMGQVKQVFNLKVRY